jgi:protocatechuate 3,4-dioxygenase, beta subunit
MPPLSARPTRLSRRTVAAACIMLPAIWTGARAQLAPTRALTPRQTEGPFYPLQPPRDQDANLIENGALRYTRGTPVWLEGRVDNPAGEPVAGARVEIWQCDADGHYDHPGDGARADRAFQGFGATLADAQGRYRFRTIRPVAYSGRTPHIHVKVLLGRRELLTTQLYVQGDPGNNHDFLWRRLGQAERAALTVAFEPASDGMLARFPIVVAA